MTTETKPKTKNESDTVYKMSFSGSYFSNDNNAVGGTKAFGPITIRMNERMVKEGPLSVFKNEIVPRRFPTIFTDFVEIATYKLNRTDTEDGSPIKNINLMNRAELEALIKNEEDVMIDIALYKNAEELRQALFDFIEDESGFLYNQSIRRTKISATAKLVPDILELNPDLVEDTKLIATDDDVVHNEIPSLADILVTKKKIELEEARAEAKAAMARDINTTGVDINTAKNVQVRGAVDTISQDTFPDGKPTYAGKKGKGANPLGNF